jgi:hypothetical protein
LLLVRLICLFSAIVERQAFECLEAVVGWQGISAESPAKRIRRAAKPELQTAVPVGDDGALGSTAALDLVVPGSVREDAGLQMIRQAVINFIVCKADS